MMTCYSLVTVPKHDSGRYARTPSPELSTSSEIHNTVARRVTGSYGRGRGLRLAVGGGHQGAVSMIAARSEGVVSR